MWPSLRTHLPNQMTLMDLGNIIPPELPVGKHFHACHDTKAILLFLPAYGEACWLLLPSSASLLSGSTVQPENTYSCILKVTFQVWERPKRISINTNHNYHQHSSPKPTDLNQLKSSTDLTIKPDLVLTNTIGKDGVQGWSI